MLRSECIQVARNGGFWGQANGEESSVGVLPFLLHSFASPWGFASFCLSTKKKKGEINGKQKTQPYDF